jgi:hypothetical protein
LKTKSSIPRNKFGGSPAFIDDSEKIFSRWSRIPATLNHDPWPFGVYDGLSIQRSGIGGPTRSPCESRSLFQGGNRDFRFMSENAQSFYRVISSNSGSASQNDRTGQHEPIEQVPTHCHVRYFAHAHWIVLGFFLGWLIGGFGGGYCRGHRWSIRLLRLGLLTIAVTGGLTGYGFYQEQQEQEEKRQGCVLDETGKHGAAQQLSTEYITIRYINCQAKCAKKIVFRSQG